MSVYQITAFDGVSLPLYNNQQDLSPAPLDSGLSDSIGGSYDRFANNRRRFPRKQPIEISGIYAESSLASLRSAVDALRSKVGVLGNLTRVRLDDNTTQWRKARLLQVKQPSRVDLRLNRAEVGAVFECANATWNAQSPVSFNNESSTPGQGFQMDVLNSGGAPVYDAKIELFLSLSSTPPVGSMVCRLSAPYAGIYLKIVNQDNLTSGAYSITILCGSRLVLQDSALPFYRHFAFDPLHKVDDWCPIPVGTTQFYTHVGSMVDAHSLVIEFYPQWF